MRTGRHRSRTTARPWPTPMQIAATATPPPRRASSCAAWPMMRPPDAPSGWPIAIAPPWMLTFSGSSSGHSCRHASDLRREGLVELDEVDVRPGPAGARERAVRGLDRSDAEHVGVVAEDAAAGDAGERLGIEHALAAEQHRRRAVVDRRRVARGDRCRRRRTAPSARRASRASCRRGCPHPARARDRRPARSRRRRRPPPTPRRRAGDCAARTRPARRARCRRSAASFSADSPFEIVQSLRSAGFVIRHPIDGVPHRLVADGRERLRRLLHDERRAAHRLDAAGEDDVGIPRLDRARPLDHGLDRRAAQPVDRHPGHARREARPAARRSARRCGCLRRPGSRRRR